LGDRQATVLRKHVLEKKTILNIDSYPERDSKKKRVFESVKMSVCIVLIQNTQAAPDYIFNVDIWDDKHRSSGLNTNFSYSEISRIDPVDFTVPRLKPEYKPLIIKLLEHKDIKLECIEGELNVTFHKRYFTQNSAFPTILKGASIQKYYYTLKMSQGQIDYLDVASYESQYGNTDKSKHHAYDRIAMQGMTGANDKVRLIMSIVPSGYYLANSCNYVLKPEEISLKCLLGILNSTIINWFFRCFSTNSNVNGYEVNNFPIAKISSESQTRIEELVSTIMAKKAVDNGADTSSEENDIDAILYDAYGLSETDVMILNQA
jgi:Alw26I/Eco31I/Esp3I family type II restriction m6 adenine DNA methyltransferase